MNSINQEQPEHNRQDLRGNAAVVKIKEIAENTGSCFFCTAVSTGDSDGVRPMSVRKVDEDGHLWFLAAADSHLNEELQINGAVKLLFQGSAHSDFLELKGQAKTSRDQAKIKELWSPVIKTWFTEGEDDPRIRVVEVEPASGYYWDNKHGDAVAGVKMLIGAALGKTLDDSIEGRVELE